MEESVATGLQLMTALLTAAASLIGAFRAFTIKKSFIERTKKLCEIRSMLISPRAQESLRPEENEEYMLLTKEIRQLTQRIAAPGIISTVKELSGAKRCIFFLLIGVLILLLGALFWAVSELVWVISDAFMKILSLQGLGLACFATCAIVAFCIIIGTIWYGIIEFPKWALAKLSSRFKETRKK